MRKIRIVADSSSDALSLRYAEFVSAPLKIITSEREFVDDFELNVAEMVEYLGKYSGRSSTSCPNVSDWLTAFGDADEVFCVTITSSLSGSYNSACIAKKTYEEEHSGRRVCLIDSLSTGPEMMLILERLEKDVEEGMEFDGICADVEEYMKTTGLLFMLKSMRNLANNGRVSPIAAKIAGIVGICAIGKASDKGTLEMLTKSRGEVRGLEAMVSNMVKLGYRDGRVMISHCLNEAAAIKLKDMILEMSPSAEVRIYESRGLCSFYAEKGGILIGFEKGQ